VSPEGILLFVGGPIERDTYDPDLFEQLAALEDRNFWFQARNRLLEWTLRREAPTARTFLEVGCGTGYVAAAIDRAFPQLETWGVDLHVEGLRIARRRASAVRLAQADAFDLPFLGGFDVVGAFDVVEHLDNDAAALDSMHSALRPGGVILLTVPQHPQLWSAFDVASNHRRRYRPNELEKKLSDAGFEAIHSLSFVTLLLPVMAVSRLRIAGRSATRTTVVDALRHGPVAGRLLGSVMRLEFELIRRGARFTIGGSRLVVARRPRSSREQRRTRPGSDSRTDSGEYRRSSLSG
jgi:SAM-dependent methyltransferase